MSEQHASAAEPADTETDAETDTEPTRFGIFDLVVAIVVGLFFATACYIAVGNLLVFPGYVVEDLQESSGAVPWVPLIAAVAIPPLAFVAGILLGRRRASFERTLVLLAAFAASSALGFSLMAISERLVSPS